MDLTFVGIQVALTNFGSAAERKLPTSARARMIGARHTCSSVSFMDIQQTEWRIQTLIICLKGTTFI